MNPKGAGMPDPQDAPTFEVAIVGLGPVGATLANLLGALGVSVVVLEREASIFALPRAVNFDDEVMRVFQTIGLAEEIASITHVSPGMRFVDGAGRLLVDWRRSSEPTTQGWSVSYHFHQPDLERVLRAGLARFPQVSVRTQCDLFALDERADDVLLRYENAASGRLESCSARYVVGCDGARSLVRRLLGSELDDLGFHQPWLVVDVLLTHDLDHLGDYSLQFCDPERPATYVRGVGPRRRWEMLLLDDEAAHVMTRPENVWPLLSRWITEADAVIERAATYVFHSVVARSWQRGRLLLAGDSAHQTPPFMGQGMCSGIRDASNLAWKLARVVRSQSSAALLETYGSERAPHARQYIELAMQLGVLIDARSQLAAADAERARTEPIVMTSIKPKLGPGLHTGDAGGRLAPQPHLTNGRLLDEEVGLRFAVLARAGRSADVSRATLDVLAARGMALVDDAAADLQGWIAGLAADFVVVRPDRQVLGVATSEPELLALIATV
jgi:3-(3-hydroxy-phenyl)propionate hydroxylase